MPELKFWMNCCFCSVVSSRAITHRFCTYCLALYFAFDHPITSVLNRHWFTSIVYSDICNLFMYLFFLFSLCVFLSKWTIHRLISRSLQCYLLDLAFDFYLPFNSLLLFKENIWSYVRLQIPRSNFDKKISVSSCFSNA